MFLALRRKSDNTRVVICVLDFEVVEPDEICAMRFLWFLFSWLSILRDRTVLSHAWHLVSLPLLDRS